MGHALPFSSIRDCLKRLEVSKTGCLVDTNFLVALTYEPHPFYEDALGAYQALVDSGVPIFAGLSTRSEFLDIQRRIIMTEALMDMIAPTSPWKLTQAATKVLRRQKLWIDTQTAGGDKLPILPDSRIKECKEVFSPQRHSGKNGWLEICQHYLANLQTAWDLAAERLGLEYIGARESEEGSLFTGKIRWQKLYEISARTCLSSQDGMLMNLFGTSVLPVLLSTDYDLAYATLAEANEKVVLIPDRLYQRKIKGLRF